MHYFVPQIICCLYALCIHIFLKRDVVQMSEIFNKTFSVECIQNRPRL